MTMWSSNLELSVFCLSNQRSFVFHNRRNFDKMSDSKPGLTNWAAHFKFGKVLGSHYFVHSHQNWTGRIFSWYNLILNVFFPHPVGDSKTYSWSFLRTFWLGKQITSEQLTFWRWGGWWYAHSGLLRLAKYFALSLASFRNPCKTDFFRRALNCLKLLLYDEFFIFLVIVSILWVFDVNLFCPCCCWFGPILFIYWMFLLCFYIIV